MLHQHHCAAKMWRAKNELCPHSTCTVTGGQALGSQPALPGAQGGWLGYITVYTWALCPATSLLGHSGEMRLLQPRAHGTPGSETRHGRTGQRPIRGGWISISKDSGCTQGWAEAGGERCESLSTALQALGAGHCSPSTVCSPAPSHTTPREVMAEGDPQVCHTHPAEINFNEWLNVHGFGLEIKSNRRVLRYSGVTLLGYGNAEGVKKTCLSRPKRSTHLCY